jgi:putative NADPH-quinone reductase
MAKITIVEGHPDPSEHRLNHALADAYAKAALGGGNEVRRIEIAELDFPVLRSAQDFQSGPPPEPIRAAQRDIAWADHIAFFYPLWIGDVPALFKAFIEQTFRPGFAMSTAAKGGLPRGLLRGKSARLVVTMGMPAPAYRVIFGAHTLRSLVMGLKMCGISPVRDTLIGGVENACESAHRKWFLQMARAAEEDASRGRSRTTAVVKTVVALGAVAAAAFAVSAALRSARRDADDFEPDTAPERSDLTIVELLKASIDVP